MSLFPKGMGLITVYMAFKDLREFEKSTLQWTGEKGKEIISHMRQGEAGSSAFKRQTGQTNRWFNLRRLDYNKPSWIIIKAEGASHLIHPTDDRILGLPEYTRIGSFPDTFKFSDDKYHKLIIGNSVPPLFMKAIALQIRHKMWGGQELEPYPKTMSYLEILESAWQDHLKPRGLDAPTFISLFAGGGGSSLGYSMAGYRELLAVEWNDNAVETFKLNFPDVPVYYGDIAKLSIDECMKLAGIQPGELDLLDGSPPCQGFSTAGKRILNDPRNQLFREYVKLLRGLKPKVFVMENVSGLVKGKMKLLFAEIMRELKASGYQVKCQLMNAKYFYVPQSRERLIFIGVRDDLGIEGSYPRAENKPITVKEAIGAKGSYTNSSFNWKRQINSPFQTFTKTKSKSHIIFDENGDRYLTIDELRKGCSYPSLFNLISFEQGIRCIGNSVPPLFMRSIANHIRQEILSNQPKGQANQCLNPSLIQAANC